MLFIHVYTLYSGGTVDITLHEVVESDKLKELDSANGGAWGGTRVDAAYENFITKITGQLTYHISKYIWKINILCNICA
jgi:hypothetical protein